jgi:hypothetical protein
VARATGLPARARSSADELRPKVAFSIVNAGFLSLRGETSSAQAFVLSHYSNEKT